MSDLSPEPSDIESKVNAFLAHWGGGKSHGSNERAKLQLFLTELCSLLELPQPEPAGADNSQNAYTQSVPGNRSK